MRNFLNAFGTALIHGMVTGTTIALIVFLVISSEKEKKYNEAEVKKYYEVENVRFTKAVESPTRGNQITVTLEVKNPDTKYLRNIYWDIEFYDSEGVFLFGKNLGFASYISPKVEDNVSLEVTMPNTIEYEKIHSAKVQVWALDI